MLLQTAIDFLPSRGTGTPAPAALMPPAARARSLSRWAGENRAGLGLHPELPIEVDGFRAVFRVGSGGSPRADIVVRLVQSVPAAVQKEVGARLGGVALRGGTTVVADAAGRVRTVVSRPVPSTSASDPMGEAGQARMRDLVDFVDTFDGYDAMGPWLDREERIPQTLNFARIDG
jgi:hypothetical protein